jgi:hypothetical protein
VIVPELSAEVLDLKARARRFVEDELYPAEERSTAAPTSLWSPR